MADDDPSTEEDIISDIVGGADDPTNEDRSGSQNTTTDSYNEDINQQDNTQQSNVSETQEEIIVQLQNTALGQKPPTKQEFNDNTNTASVAEVENLFGGWVAAIEKAGLDPTLSDDELETTSGVGEKTEYIEHQERFENQDSPPEKHTNFFNRRSWPGTESMNKNEDVELAAPPHWFQSIRRYFAGGVMSLIGLFLSIHYLGGWTNDYLQSGNLPLGIKLEVTTSYFVGVVLLAIAGFAVILWAHAQRNHTWHIITNQRVWVKTGIFSTEDLADLEYNKINNIKQKKPYPIKKFDVGHIELYTAASDGAEVTMHYIKDPDKWKREIRSHIADEDDQIDE